MAFHPSTKVGMNPDGSVALSLDLSAPVETEFSKSPEAEASRDHVSKVTPLQRAQGILRASQQATTPEEREYAQALVDAIENRRGMSVPCVSAFAIVNGETCADPKCKNWECAVDQRDAALSQVGTLTRDRACSETTRDALRATLTEAEKAGARTSDELRIAQIEIKSLNETCDRYLAEISALRGQRLTLLEWVDRAHECGYDAGKAAGK